MSQPAQERNVVTLLSEWFSKLAVWSFDRRWFVFVICMLLLGLFTWQSMSLRQDNSFEAYFDQQDPIYSAYLRYRDDFGSDEVSFLLYEAADYEHGPFNEEVMEKIAKLAEAIEDEVPFIYEVTALSNAELMVGNEEGLDILSWQDDYADNQQTLLEFKKKILKKHLYIGGLISEEARYGALIIDMDRSSTDPIDDIRLDPDGGDGLDNLYPQVTYDKLTEILQRSEYAELKILHSGDVALNSIMNRLFLVEGAELGGISALIILLLLLLLFQFRLLGVLGPIVVVFMSMMLAFAVMAMMDWPADMMSSMMPLMIIAIGVAASVHILSEFWLYYEKTGDRREAIRETLYLVGPPCLLTALTTAAGFLAMSISPIKTIANMAVYSAIGVLGSFFFSVTLLMFFLSFGKKIESSKRPEIFRRGTAWATKRLHAVADFNIRFRIQLLWFFTVVFMVAIYGITKVEVNSNFIEEFSDRVEIKHTTKFIDKVMGGTGSVTYLFDTHEPDGIKNPAVLKEIERIQQEVVRQDYLVNKTYSIVDLLKDINQSFHGDDPAYYKIPESRALISQLLLVYELSGGEELSEYVSTDYSRASLDVRCKNTATSVFERFQQEMDHYIDANPIVHSDITMTGIGRLWLQLIDHIVTSQIKGLFLAFCIIAALMCFIFRSVKTGLLTMIPNVTPVFLALGMMGLVGLHLDYTRLLIATVAIGLAVDDTIHMVTRYHHEYQRTGCYEKGLYNTFEGVGRALVITSVVLIAGFMVYVLSSMVSMLWFGVLLSFTILLALIADFFLMPALMMTFKPFGPTFNVDQRHSENG